MVIDNSVLVAIASFEILLTEVLLAPALDLQNNTADAVHVSAGRVLRVDVLGAPLV